MLRVLDSFGTEPEFNHAHYAQSKGHKTPWGKWNLNPQQFNTMFRKSIHSTAPGGGGGAEGGGGRDKYTGGGGGGRGGGIN